jgi:hypothetical protein
MRRLRSTIVIALLGTLTLATPCAVARASTADPPAVNVDWREALDYLNCILSLVAAQNGPGFAAAMTSCTRAIQDHWSD